MVVLIKNVFDHIEQLPEPPKAAIQALSMLEDPAVPMAKAAEFISMDEGLTTRILRMGNAAHYGFSRKVFTVRDAMMRVGTTVITSCLHASMMEAAQFGANPYFQQLWEKSLLTAFLARDLSQALGYSKPELCFTAALLADIGQFVFNKVEGEAYAALLTEATSPKAILDAEKEAFAFTHPQVGAKVADLWSLPHLYQQVIRYHEEPTPAFTKALPDDYKAILVIHFASRLTPEDFKQSAAHIDQQAFKKINSGFRMEPLLNPLELRLAYYLKDIRMIADSIF